MNKVIRFSPRADLSRMQRDFDHIFSNFFPSLGTDPDSNEPISWQPRMDVVETTDAYELAADVPGVGKEDIQINLHEGVLTISGQRNSRVVTESDTVVREERQTGRFYRSFSLPNKIDATKIDARFENGVLFVRVPKLEETKPQKIKIS
ncbi:MAG: Hsp20/alpha crystallin family protein [Bacteroidetes bacterium]|nr:Hsp20/alpha crystallin family protein [Bacteroidota bacterium]